MGKVVLGSSFHRDFCPIIVFLDYSKNYLVGNKTNCEPHKVNSFKTCGLAG